MSKFYARNGQFWLDDQPQLIQAGEFHYFRTPQTEWRHRLDLLKAAGFNAVAAYIPWLWHQPEKGASDFDGHSHPMRNLAGFLDLAAEMGLLIIARPGPYIMAETINEGIPPWVFQNFPQIAFVSQDQNPQNLASYLHPDFLACVRQWYRAVFEVLTPRQVTRGGKIIMIQLDNEMGMPQWVRNIFDVNPDTLSRFAIYLRQTYGHHLSARYPAEDLSAFLRASLITPTAPHAVTVVEDYRRFYRAYLREYTAFLWAEAQANGMDVPPVVNIHGFMNGGKTFPIGLSQLVSALEIEGVISATDVYPIFINTGNFHQLLMVNETTKALQNKDQALFSIEFQSGGNYDFGAGETSLYDLHSRLCISTGMRAVNHYLFFDGENDPILSPVRRHEWGHPVRKDGSLRKHYFRYPQLSSVLQAYGDDLILSRPQTVTTIGFLLDDFMTEVNNGLTQKATDILTYQRETILFDFIARGLALTHRPFEALELTRAPLDARQTPVCWVMMEQQCPAVVQEKLMAYVRQGGSLILVGRMCVEDFHHQPCTLLKEALGVSHLHSGQPFTPALMSAFHHQDIPVNFVETYEGEFDEVFARRQGGGVTGFIKAIGNGKAMVLGAALTANTLDDLDVLHQMALRMGCLPLFKLSDWADVRLSRADKGSFLFVNNYLDDPLVTTIDYRNETLFGGHWIDIPARRGLILPLDWQVRPGLTLHYCTAEINAIVEDETTLILKTAQKDFCAELSLTGYMCDQAQPVNQRLVLQSNEGRIVLRKN